MLRVAIAIGDDAARCEFYAAVTGSLYASVAAGRPPAIDLAAALDAAGVDPGLAVCADDERLDDDIRASMTALRTLLPLRDAAGHTVPALALCAAGGRVESTYAVRPTRARRRATRSVKERARLLLPPS